MVKIRGGDCGKAGMRVLLRRVVPRGSERLKSCAIGASAIGASVLRARISLAALDSQNIFSVDSD